LTQKVLLTLHKIDDDFWLMRGVFVRSWRLTGMTNYMMNVYADPEFLHLLIEFIASGDESRELYNDVQGRSQARSVLNRSFQRIVKLGTPARNAVSATSPGRWRPSWLNPASRPVWSMFMHRRPRWLS